MDWYLATWNVRSLFKAGALKILIKELSRYNIMIAAIQEIRWRGSEIFESGNYTVCYSGSDDRNNFGTGFLIHKKIKHNILDFAPINERICRLRMRGRFFNTSIICIHAPTEEKDESVKNTFYDLLDRTCQQIPKNDVTIIMGDMNAKIGREFMTPNIGKYSLHEESNDNGERLCDFAITRGFVISSTLFPHKNIHLQTWTSPDGTTVNQIDHVMINSRHASDILDVRSLRGADCDSDHFMVRVKYRSKLSTLPAHQSEKRKKYDIGKLKDITVANEYRQTIEDKLDDQKENETNIEHKWLSIKKCIKFRWLFQNSIKLYPSVLSISPFVG